jgi:hypothetical protein
MGELLPRFRLVLTSCVTDTCQGTHSVSKLLGDCGTQSTVLPLPLLLLAATRTLTFLLKT